MDDITRTFLNAVERLEDSANVLDQAIAETQAVQDKHDAVVKRIIDLVKTRERNWDSTARSSLSSLSGKHALHQRTLEKQQDRLGKARKTYKQHHTAFATLVEKYSDRVQDFKTADRNRQRREAALCRALDRLIYDVWPGRGEPGMKPSDFKFPIGSHTYIALDVPRFLNLLMELDTMLTVDPAYAVSAGRYRPVTFLEIGAGQGRNMIIARNSRLVLWDSLEGFDINSDMVAGGQSKLGLGDALFVADAMTFDYGKHDVIYSFRPFSDLDMQSQLEEQIAKTMRPGAYFLAPHAYDLGLFPELERMGDELEIWRKAG